MMTDQTDTRARQAEQIAWQRYAATLLGKILELAAREHLPPIAWTVGSAGATLHGSCLTHTHSHPLRREDFTTWREAIAAASGQAPDTDAEHAHPSGEIRLVARWEWISVGLTTGRPGDSRADVTLTASIWPDDDDWDDGKRLGPHEDTDL